MNDLTHIKYYLWYNIYDCDYIADNIKIHTIKTSFYDKSCKVIKYSIVVDDKFVKMSEFLPIDDFYRIEKTFKRNNILNDLLC